MEKTVNVRKQRNPVILIQDIVYDQVRVNMHILNRPLHLDLLRRGSSQSLPLIIWIEGGGWISLNKSYALPELQYLAEAGFAIASIEYRQSSEGGFPAGLQDVKAAIRYLAANADKFLLSVDRIGLMGRSAGGNIASLVGSDPEFMPGSRRNGRSGGLPVAAGVVSMYAINDFESYYAFMEKRKRSEILTNIKAYLGGTPQEKTTTARKASPAACVSEGTAPHLILHGTNDPIVPASQSSQLYEALCKNHVPADFLRLEGAGHGTDEFDQPEIRELIVDFWRKALK